MQIDRIATLIASGLPDEAVGTIVGLSPGRISQIKKEDSFQLLLAEKRALVEEKDAEEVSISAKYLAAEHALLKQVVEMAPVSELRDVVGALRVVAERQERAKARVNPIVQGAPVLNQVIQLQLPDHAVPRAAMNLTSTREVIAIENRNLAPLSSSGVLDLFKGMEPADISNKGEGHEPSASLKDSERGSQAALSQASSQTLADSAKKFLDSLHPAPLARSF